jgi:hypothetical protein
MPRMANNLEQVEARFKGNTSGTLAAKWIETKK